MLGYIFLPRWNLGLKNKSIDSLYCSSPRKSLVKGERFIRGMKRNQSFHSWQILYIYNTQLLHLRLIKKY